jgi:hypothetical protein
MLDQGKEICVSRNEQSPVLLPKGGVENVPPV